MENLDKKHSYPRLLKREQKNMQLLFDLIELNLPVESYMPLVRYKLKQLTDELQAYNHEDWMGSKERVEFMKLHAKTEDKKGGENV
jgi:hypothetical protein